MNDDEMIERMRAAERDVALNADADQRVFDRMMQAHASEASTTGGARTTEQVLEFNSLDTAPLDEQGPAVGRRSVVLTRAALIMVVAVGLIGVVLASTTSDDSTPAVSEGALPGPATAPGSAPAAELDGLRTVLGFRPFSTYSYRDRRTEPNRVSSSPMAIRVGELAADGTATVRRLLAGDERIVADLAPSGDDAVVVPVEFIDPALFGGTCTGGAIELTRTSARTDSTAICGGVDNVALEVASSLGASEQLELATGTAVDAAPLSIAIQAANATAARTVTLWFSDDGVVRWSFPTSTGVADYDLLPDGSDGLG